MRYKHPETNKMRMQANGSRTAQVGILFYRCRPESRENVGFIDALSADSDNRDSGMRFTCMAAIRGARKFVNASI
jgi:hypothetical protein